MDRQYLPGGCCAMETTALLIYAIVLFSVMDILLLMRCLAILVTLSAKARVTFMIFLLMIMSCMACEVIPAREGHFICRRPITPTPMVEMIHLAAPSILI